LHLRLIGIVLISNALISHLGFAQSKERIRSFVGEGESEISKGNSLKARKEALHNAMISAVESFTQTIVPTSILNENKEMIARRFFKDVHPYVQDYKILSDQVTGHSLQIKVQIVPNEQSLKNDLSRYGILYEQSRRPRIGIHPIIERKQVISAKKAPSSIWTHQVVKGFRRLGFDAQEITAIDNRPAASTRKVDNPPFDLILSGFYSLYANNVISFALEATISNSTENSAKIQETFPINDPSELIGGILSTSALEAALPIWLRSTSQGNEYYIVMSGLKNYQIYKELRETLNSPRYGFSSGYEQTYAPSRVTFKVSFNGSVQDLVKAIGKIQLSNHTKPMVSELIGTTVYVDFK